MGDCFKKVIMTLTLAFCLFAPNADLQAGSLTSTQASSDKAAEMANPVASALVPSGSAAVSRQKQYTGDRVALDLNQADLFEVIKALAEISGKNAVFSDSAAASSSEKITLKLKDIPWDQALDMALAAKNLAAEESGNVLTIYDADEFRKIQEGRKQAGTGNVAAPLAKKVFSPKYAPIDKISKELTKIKSERGKIVAVGKDIYVEDEPRTIAAMEQVFKDIDGDIRRIIIEVRIIEAAPSFVEALAIEWNNSPVDSGPGQAAVVFSTLKRAASLMLSAEISPSESASAARTVAAPRIMAFNDQEVSIPISSFEIYGFPIAQKVEAPSGLAQVDQDSSIIIVKPVHYVSGSSVNSPPRKIYKECSMEIKVRPHIEENEQALTLELKLVKGYPGFNEPEAGPAEVETNIIIKDGETVLIGGLGLGDQLESENRIPGLSGLPLSDWFCYERSNEDLRSELLVFLTASIMHLKVCDDDDKQRRIRPYWCLD